MLRRSDLLFKGIIVPTAMQQQQVMSFWDTPFAEQMPFWRFWKHGDGKTGFNYSQALPRSVNGCMEFIQPRTSENVKWYPYRNEFYVNDKQVPSFYDILYTHYFPQTPTDDERIHYVAEKSGRKPIDVAAEMFRMRRLRLGVCQALRDKIKGKWIRQPLANWNRFEKNYLDQTYRVAQIFGLDMYSNQNFDPTVVYSKPYGFADTVDCIFNKQARSVQQFLLIEVIVHNSLPKSRMCDVRGTCREPLQHIEPCLYEAIKLKLEVFAYLVKQEGYVTDHMFDGGHHYQGAIVHMFRGLHNEKGEVDFKIELVELDHQMGARWLKHYMDNHVNPNQDSPDTRPEY